MAKISRKAYADMFGPTTGDRVRLADTDLFAEVEKDFTVPGEEVKFGGGKVIRDGMGQGQQPARAVADTVITNALIIDGAESFDTNQDLAPAYFGGKAKKIEVPGAEKAYLVIADTFNAPVIGMLVNGSFVLLQVGVEGATPEQAQSLATLVAARVP